MIENREFSAFGRKYRCTKFSAIEGIKILELSGNIHPTVILRKTEAFNENDGIWYPLSIAENINIFAFDLCGIACPRLVLNGILDLVQQYNFEFVQKWRGVNVPYRFREHSNVVNSSYIPSILSALIKENTASLEKLETYYNLQDAFMMFDVLTEKAVNSCYATEAARNKK